MTAHEKPGPVAPGDRILWTGDGPSRTGTVDEVFDDGTAWVEWDPPHHCDDCLGSLVNVRALSPAKGAT